MHLHYILDLWYEIIIQNIAFACNMTLLDEIYSTAFPECIAKVKLIKMVPKSGLFFADKNVQKYPLEWS